MRIIILLGMVLVLLSCEKKKTIKVGEPVTACGIENVQKNLPWLVKMIEESENDKTLRKRCTIWLEKYKGDDIFVVRVYVSSVAYFYYDCQGNSFVPDKLPLEMREDIIVYSAY